MILNLPSGGSAAELPNGDVEVAVRMLKQVPTQFTSTPCVPHATDDYVKVVVPKRCRGQLAAMLLESQGILKERELEDLKWKVEL